MRKSGACDDEKRLLYVPRKLLRLAALTGDSLKFRGGQRLGGSVSGILPLCAVRLYAAPGRDTEKRNPGAAL